MMVNKCAVMLGDSIRWEPLWAMPLHLETWRTLVTSTKQDHSVCDDREQLRLEGGEQMARKWAHAWTQHQWKSLAEPRGPRAAAPSEGPAMGEFSFFGHCFKIETRACGREDISLSRKDQPLQVKEGLLENVQDNILYKTCQATDFKDPLWNHFFTPAHTAEFLTSSHFERTWLCWCQPLTVSSDDVETCIVIHVLSSSLLLSPGTDEDVESPELTTSRTLAKIPSTSSAPQVETTTLKMQNKIPTQTKVGFVLRCVVRLQ